MTIVTFCSWHTSLLGALFCVGAMLIVSWWLAIFYAIGFLILFIVVSKSTASNDWGDAVSGLMYQQVTHYQWSRNSVGAKFAALFE